MKAKAIWPLKLFFLLLWPMRRSFVRALRNPERAQRRVLERLVRKVAATAQARELGLTTDDGFDLDAFRKKVPIRSWDGLSGAFEREYRGERGSVVSGRIFFFERTTGSSGIPKRIPYGRELVGTYGRMLVLWLQDLLFFGPRFASGRTYLSLSPGLNTADTPPADGIADGAQSDLDYFPAIVRPLVRPFLVEGPAREAGLSAEGFKLATICAWIAYEDLEVFGVWNPSFVSAHLAYAEQNAETVYEALLRGEVEGKFYFRAPSPSRAERLLEKPIRWSELWPELTLISCWASAHAAPSANALARVFPQAVLQPKGLLATESPMTVPWQGVTGGLPLVQDIFFEFLDEPAGIVRGLAELELDREYAIVLSHAGGLLRYRIGDRVRTHPGIGRTPALEFVGREGVFCDLVGEKLDAQFAGESLARAWGQAAAGALLVPDATVAGPRAPRYIALYETSFAPEPQLDRAATLERELRRNPHYDLARRIGQLGATDVRPVADLSDWVLNFRTARGMRLGDIKAEPLVHRLEEARDLLSALERREGSE